MNEMITVARERLIIWPSHARLLDWLGCYLSLKVQTFDLKPNHELPANLKILTIDKN